MGDMMDMPEFCFKILWGGGGREGGRENVRETEKQLKAGGFFGQY